MFEICIDNEGYYAEGVTERKVTAQGMPKVEDVRYLLAYYYDENTNLLTPDEEKLEKIKVEIE